MRSGQSESACFSVEDFLLQNSSLNQPEFVDWTPFRGAELSTSVIEGSYDIDSLVFTSTAYQIFNHPVLKSQLSISSIKIFK